MTLIAYLQIVTKKIFDKILKRYDNEKKLLAVIGHFITANILKAAVKIPADWVDPLIGTHLSRWFYLNSTTRPSRMINLSPDTETNSERRRN